MPKQNILLTGASGQLGKTFQLLWPDSGLTDRFELHCVSRQALDITNSDSVALLFEELKPAAVVNCAAYTAVDKAESDTDNAFLVNEIGARNLARCCKKAGSHLVHVSTDFVFSGDFSSPIKPTQETNPAGVYGASKRAGEIAIKQELGDKATIFRTSWLYSSFNANFVKTMLRLMAERDSLGVVADQRGAPTSTFSLCEALFKAIDNKEVAGIYHWSDIADISWYDFAIGIQEIAVAKGILPAAITVNPIATRDYPTPAKRPSYSVLDCSSSVADLKLEQSNWRKQLEFVIQRIKESNENGQEKLGA